MISFCLMGATVIASTICDGKVWQSCKGLQLYGDTLENCDDKTNSIDTNSADVNRGDLHGTEYGSVNINYVT